MVVRFKPKVENQLALSQQGHSPATMRPLSRLHGFHSWTDGGEIGLDNPETTATTPSRANVLEMPKTRKKCA